MYHCIAGSPRYSLRVLKKNLRMLGVIWETIETKNILPQAHEACIENDRTCTRYYGFCVGYCTILRDFQHSTFNTQDHNFHIQLNLSFRTLNSQYSPNKIPYSPNEIRPSPRGIQSQHWLTMRNVTLPKVTPGVVA